MKPKNYWHKGEQRINPKGVLLDGLHETSYWVTPLMRNSPRTIKEVLDELLSILEPKMDALKSLKDLNTKISLYITAGSDPTVALELSSERLERFSKLGIDLDFEIFTKL